MIRITLDSAEGRVITTAEPGLLLRVSIREKGGIPFKCGAGLCGTCKCLVTEGREHLDAIKAKERKHLTDEEFAAGWRMACQTFISGDISITWPPKPGTIA